MDAPGIDDALHLDHVAYQREFLRLFEALTHEGKRYLGSLGATHQVNRLGDGHPFGQLVADLPDVVVGLDPGTKGGSVFYRRNDSQFLVPDVDFDAESAERAGH